MNDAARMTIVAQELMVSLDDVEGLVAAADQAGILLSASDIIAAVAGGDGLLWAEARRRAADRHQHPSQVGGIRPLRFGP